MVRYTHDVRITRGPTRHTWFAPADPRALFDPANENEKKEGLTRGRFCAMPRASPSSLSSSLPERKQAVASAWA